MRQVFYTTYALFPTTGLSAGDEAYGTDTKILYRWNGASWDPITASSSATQGSYTGNSAANRNIAHGLPFTPKAVFIMRSAEDIWFQIWGALALITKIAVPPTALAVTIPDSTSFYVGNAGDYPNSANMNALVYYWVAIG
jgi:hypothetical protein